MESSRKVECPYCGNELEVIDYYGKIKRAEHYYQYPQSWIEKEGDILECENEDCESEKFNFKFHTDKDNNLKEGYPC